MAANPLIRTPEEVARLFPWLHEEPIRGIPHFISPAWTTDRSHFDPEHYAECWERIGFRSVTLLTGHHDGFLLYPSDLCAQKPDRDYFGEQVQACAKRGIRVMAYYSLTLDSLVGSEHPEWRVRDMAGRVHQPNYGQFSHYHWLCLNSPYRDFAVKQIEEVVTRYEVDGVWIDILYLPQHTEDMTRDTCFCDHCHRQYSEWYAGEHLLDAAGEPRHDEFRMRTYRGFLTQLKTMLMSQERPICLTFNGAGRRRQVGYRACDDLADFLSGEAHDPVSLSLTSKSHRNDERPFELLSCAEVCWSHNQLKPATLIKLESLGTLIAGGTYTIGITHAPDGRLSSANVTQLTEWSRWIRQRQDLLKNASPVYEAGLLAPEGGPAGCDAWAELLRQAHVQFNVFMDLQAGASARTLGSRPPAGLDKYGLIIVPAGRGINSQEATALAQYVRAGGRLFIEDPSEQLHDGDRLMQDLIGAELRSQRQAYAFYLEPKDPVLVADLPPGEPVLVYAKSAAILEPETACTVAHLVPQFRDKVRTSDIQTVANYWAREDEAQRPPGMVVNTLGEGIVMASAIPLTVRNRDAERCPWPRTLAGNCVRYLLEQPMVSLAGCTQVEVNVCQQPGRTLVHFLNHGYGPGPAIHGKGEVDFISDIRVSLAPQLSQRVSRVVLEPEGDELALTEDGFTVPRLGVYQAVALYDK